MKKIKVCICQPDKENMKSFNETISSIDVNQFELFLGLVGPMDNLINSLDLQEDGLNKITILDQNSDNYDDFKAYIFSPNGLSYLRSFFKTMEMIEKNHSSVDIVVLYPKDYWVKFIEWVKEKNKDDNIMFKSVNCIELTNDIKEAFNIIKRKYYG